MAKEGCKLATKKLIFTAFGARPPVVAKELPPEIREAPSHPICTVNTHTSGLTTTSQISGGDLFVIYSGNKDKRLAATWRLPLFAYLPNLPWRLHFFAYLPNLPLVDPLLVT